MDLEIIKSYSPENISLVCKEYRAVLDCIHLGDGLWMISRVNVGSIESRGLGVGSGLLLVLDAVLKQMSANKVVVAPGGYNEDRDRQYQFYRNNGFVDDLEVDGLLTKSYVGFV